MSGIYLVTHGADHRPAHEVTMAAGDVFPPCRQCGQQVRFRLLVEDPPAPLC